jgi:hypothetical protein
MRIEILFNVLLRHADKGCKTVAKQARAKLNLLSGTILSNFKMTHPHKLSQVVILIYFIDRRIQRNVLLPFMAPPKYTSVYSFIQGVLDQNSKAGAYS